MIKPTPYYAQTDEDRVLPHRRVYHLGRPIYGSKNGGWFPSTTYNASFPNCFFKTKCGKTMGISKASISATLPYQAKVCKQCTK